MNNYLDQLAIKLKAYPVTLDAIPKDELTSGMFNKLQQARLLKAIQDRYIQRPLINPIEKFGQGSASDIARIQDQI